MLWVEGRTWQGHKVAGGKYSVFSGTEGKSGGMTPDQASEAAGR